MGVGEVSVISWEVVLGRACCVVLAVALVRFKESDVVELLTEPMSAAITVMERKRMDVMNNVNLRIITIY